MFLIMVLVVMLVVCCVGCCWCCCWLGKANYIFRQVADGLVDRAFFGELGLKFLLADAAEPESISKEVLGLIFGSDYNFKAVVFHCL